MIVSIEQGEYELDPIESWKQGLNAPNEPLLMLRKLSEYLQSVGIPPTYAIAWQSWEYLLQNQERLQNYSDIAYWYKINPFSLSERQRFSLFASLPRVQAQEQIFLGNYEPTDYEGVYQLYKLAYDDEDRAQTAKVEAFKRYVDEKTSR